MTAPTPAERQASLTLANQFQCTGSDDSAADPDTVADAWDTVKSRLVLPASRHRACESLTQLGVSDEEIDRMIFVKVNEMERYLKARRPHRHPGVCRSR